MNKKISSLMFASLPLWGACADGELERDGLPGRIVSRLEAKNGLEMNGTQINGVHMNGVHMNGVHMNGVHMNGIHMNGTELAGFLSDTGVEVQGAGFLGISLISELADGRTAELRVDEAVDEGQGRFSYRVSYFNGTTWSNICSNNGLAYPLQGQWNYSTGEAVSDPDVFTFACRNAALGKCVDWGYRQDGSLTESSGGVERAIALGNFHQACTRMVRADYCGNGVPHTMNGTLIDVWDNFSLQSETPNSGLSFEAEWSPRGATCIKHTRWAVAGAEDVRSYIQTYCPERWVGPDDPACGGGGSTFFTQNGFDTPPDTRALLRNASYPQ